MGGVLHPKAHNCPETRLWKPLLGASCPDIGDQCLCRSSPAGAAGCRSATASEPANTLADDAGTRLPELAALTRVGVLPPVSDGLFSNSCALQVGMHRLLIQPDPTPEDSRFPYRLFSCVLDGSRTCNFESSS